MERPNATDEVRACLADPDRPTYTRVHPCPECGHDTEHNDEVCYCEVPGCDCDRTSVVGFWVALDRGDA